MSELPPPAARAERRDARRHGRPPVRGMQGTRALYLWVAVLPAAVMALLGAATVVALLAPGSAAMTRVVLAVAVAGVVLVLAAAGYGAEAVTRQVHRRIGALGSLSARGQEDLQRLVEKVKSGERFAPSDAEVLPAEGGDPFVLLAHDLQRGRHAAQNAVLQVANLTPGGESDQRVEVFVNLARRMQSLVHREIQLLDELEAQVEDPDLLKGLFTVDHLATRMRRQSESLAVLGGAASRRQWSRPVTMYEVLRSAVAEVEHYSRVKLVPPIEGTLDGSAVADVIHLVAELVENATKFSPPHTQVLLRAEHVTAGLAIEAEDRGLGMPLDDQRRMNGLLADPGRINIGELLRDGRIGLFVVSALARRHGVKVQLRTNVYGGTQAVVVLPNELIGTASQVRETRVPTQSAHPEAIPASAAIPAAIPAAPQRPASAPIPPEAAFAVSGHSTGSWQTPPANDQYSVDSRLGEPLVAASGGRRPELPVREPGAHPGVQDSNRGPLPVASAADLIPHDQSDNGERPPLPERRVQTHLAPQLRESTVTRHDEPAADHTPDLMASFQGGFNRSEEEDEENGPSDRPHSTS
ncbi:MAG: sensor-like histidine kinase [Actinoallomurus sp.]|nr:sensor-like histidine kinase [Actinoallomurus sp.]